MLFCNFLVLYFCTRSQNRFLWIFVFTFRKISYQFINVYIFCFSPFKIFSQVIRTLCYAAKLASALNVDRHPDAANKLKIFSSKMSQTRATLRLFDDLPMLQCTLQYGLGKHEPDQTLSVIGVLTNIFDTIYYPIDKTCWLVEHKLLHVKNPTLWDTLSSLFWLLSNYLNLIK